MKISWKLLHGYYIFIICITRDLCALQWTNNDIIFGKTLSQTTPFYQMIGVSFISCVKECLFRKHCKGMSYQRKTYLCLLFDREPSTAEIEQDPSFVMTNINDWPEDLISPCTKHLCDNWEKCIIFNDGTTGCIPSECAGDLQDNRASTVIVHRYAGRGYAKHSCYENYTASGSPYQTCQEDGAWSEKSYKCSINGQWSEFRNWVQYEACSVSCGGGLEGRIRTRTCTNPAPEPEGKYCEGSDEEIEYIDCNQLRCPADCVLPYNITLGGNTSYKVCPIKTNQPNAELICNQHDGHLVRIDDNDEMVRLQQYLTENYQRGFWMDGSDRLNEGDYVYSNGQQVLYFDWYIDNKDNNDERDCLFVGVQRGFTFDRAKCLHEKFFLCEYPYTVSNFFYVQKYPY